MACACKNRNNTQPTAVKQVVKKAVKASTPLKDKSTSKRVKRIVYRRSF